MIDASLDDSRETNDFDKSIVGVGTALVLFASIYNRVDTVNDSREWIPRAKLVHLYQKHNAVRE